MLEDYEVLFSVDDIDPEVITIFTDGSCHPNPGGKGGWGYVGLFGELVVEGKGHLKSTTTNRAELTAMLEALKRVQFPSGLPVLIITDSQYALRCMTEWRPKWEKSNWLNSINQKIANQDIIKKAYKEVDRIGDVKFKWVRGHQTVPSVFANYNNWADRLAGEGHKMYD